MIFIKEFKYYQSLYRMKVTSLRNT